MQRRYEETLSHKQTLSRLTLIYRGQARLLLSCGLSYTPVYSGLSWVGKLAWPLDRALPLPLSACAILEVRRAAEDT